MKLLSSLSHAGVTAGAAAVGWLVGGAVGASVGAGLGVAYYWGREGAEAQWASGRPKAKTWWMPLAPWVWPAQMVADFLAPVAVLVLYVIIMLVPLPA